MPTATLETVLPAPREVVYPMFRERDRLDPVLPIRIALRRPGAGSRSGVGARYHLGIAGIGPTEETTELVAGERMVYRMVAGAPVRHHLGTITFADAPGGTRVSYTIEMEPGLPVPARIVEVILTGLIGMFLRGAGKAIRTGRTG